MSSPPPSSRSGSGSGSGAEGSGPQSGAERVHVRVRAVPGSRSTEVIGRYGEAWKIRVTAAPERGRANDELTRFLARLLGINRSAVVVTAGTASRDKTLAITGVDDAELQLALERASGV